MELLAARAAAARLGVSYSTLKLWIHNGTVRTTTTAGGHHRVSEAEIDRLLARSAHPVRRRSPRKTGAVLVTISGRNQLRGFVDEVRTDGILGQVRLRIGDQLLTAVITADAIRELRLRRGDDAIAVIKATEVMIARESGDRAAPGSRKTKRR